LKVTRLKIEECFLVMQAAKTARGCAGSIANNTFILQENSTYPELGRIVKKSRAGDYGTTGGGLILTKGFSSLANSLYGYTAGGLDHRLKCKLKNGY